MEEKHPLSMKPLLHHRIRKVISFFHGSSMNLPIVKTRGFQRIALKKLPLSSRGRSQVPLLHQVDTFSFAFFILEEMSTIFFGDCKKCFRSRPSKAFGTYLRTIFKAPFTSA